MTKILSRKDVCALLKISPPTLHKLMKKGLIPAYRVGRKIIFKEHELLNCLKSVNYGNE